MQSHLASAIFDTRAEAERAVADLRAAGVSDSALSVITQGEHGTTTTTGDSEVTDDGHGSILRGILGGSALGAGLGIAALAIPGVGPFVAAGAIAASAIPGAAAIGAVAGAAAGTLNETLVHHGIAKDDADYYGHHLKGEGVLVTVDTRSVAVTPEAVRDVLHRNGGHSSTHSRALNY